MCRITTNLYDCPHYNRILLLCEHKQHKRLERYNYFKRRLDIQQYEQRVQQHFEQQLQLQYLQSRGQRYSKQLPLRPPPAAPQHLIDSPAKESKRPSFWSFLSSSSYSTSDPIPRPLLRPAVQWTYNTREPPKEILQHACSLRKISIQTTHHRDSPCTDCKRKEQQLEKQKRKGWP